MNITNETLARLREDYPIGCRVRLIEMDNTQAPPIGTLGTVKGVDDIGSIMVAWDTGSSLSVVYGADRCERVSDALNKIKAFARIQMDGSHFCPRCGRMTVKDRLTTNALSRLADVYICDDCGTDEAIRAYSGTPFALEDWAIAMLPFTRGK